MDTDKENLNRSYKNTKIPLPLEPLPPLPVSLINKKCISESEHRPPLKTINNQQINHSELAGPSKNTKKIINVHPLKLDTRHVTIRQKSEVLDWGYEVFRDNPDEENTVIIISDDEDDNKENIRHEICKADKKQRNLGESKRVETPTLNSLEPNRIKNIKRSLKRPHSRELQGLPSASKRGEQKKEAERATWRRQYFCERLIDRLQRPDHIQKLYMKCLTRDYTSDVFNYLLRAEAKPIVPHITSETRACVINWLIKVNGPDGDIAIVQTACWYLDTILGTGYVELNKLQLVATACYWVAQKLRGPSVQASRLVKCAKGAFTAQQLMAAEKAVLLKLKFPSHPVVPEDYIEYLSWNCDKSHPGETAVAATFLCMSGLMVNKTLCNVYPSVVAAAAVKNALLLLKKKELNKELESLSVFKEAKKKAVDIAVVCLAQIKAVRLMAVPGYEYRAPYEYYSCGPYYIAQRVVKAADDMATMCVRNK